jgi:hypothetical protein
MPNDAANDSVRVARVSGRLTSRHPRPMLVAGWRGHRPRGGAMLNTRSRWVSLRQSRAHAPFTAIAALGMASAAFASDVVIYDDALQNDFLDFSYVSGAGAVDLASTAHVHAGTKAIAFAAGGYDALKFASDTTLFDTATRSKLQLWFYGTQAQCQGVDVILERNNGAGDDQLAIGPLKDYAGNCTALVPGQWLEITVDFTSAPLSYNGTYDRISLFNHGGAAFGPVWFDDLALQAPGVDQIFRNGFEGSNLPPPACGMTDEHDVSVLSMASDRFGWCDAAGDARKATLAHFSASAGPGGTRGGELREFRYETDAGTRVVAAPARADGGFGYIVSHPLSEDHCVGGDSSSLGHFFTGTWTRVFEGRHHAIFRFQQNYPRYCTTAAPAAEHDIPVTIDWVFANGRDDPLWAVTFDMSGFADGTIEDDSRAPYGTMNIDGSAGVYMDSAVGGMAWGDRRKFATTDAPATLDSDWTWNAANSVPYAELWAFGSEAAMGLVQTQTVDQHDAGGGRQPYGAGTYDVSTYWGTTSAAGKACPDGTVDQLVGVAHYLPCVGLWPYQMNSFSYGNLVDPTDDAKLTWGTQYGFLGNSAYQRHDSTLANGSTAVGWPRQSYSLYVVLGEHGRVAARVAEVEARQSLTLGIAGGIGSVATSGPAGVNRVDTITYSPAGYDPVYGALAFNASSNALDATITVGAGALKHPLLIVRNYTSANYPATVKWNGAPLAIDVDYLPSLRGAPANELWITLNRDVSGAGNTLQVVP